MRRRATFIHEHDDDFDPADIQLKGRQLLHPGLKAAREERLTYGLEDLPAELAEVLRQSHELHVRWISEQPYNTTAPYLSSLSSGLHVHYTPLNRQASNLLCPILKTFSSELECITPDKSFIKPSLVSERFASSASLQYYSILPSLTHLVAYLQQNVCAPSNIMCLHTASLLNAAEYVDFDYDSISHALIVTAFWSKPLPAYYDPIGALTFLDQWPLDIRSSKNDRVEVGIMTTSEATDRHELKMGGFLAVVGEDDKPKPTLFSFPSRHHALPESQAQLQSYTVSFTQPTGLHPILEIGFQSASALEPPSTRPGGSACALHAYFVLPSGIFADEYAFPVSSAESDPLFQKANNIISLRSIAGELDLEAPDYVVERWGSTALLELATPSVSSPISTDSKSERWTVTVPLHLRYQAPSDYGNTNISLPWPSVFWACTAEDGTKFPINPFDRTNLGYDGLFGSRTMFYHLSPDPSTNTLVERVSVPILNTQKIGGDQVVELGTVVVVLLGFLWIFMKLWPAVMNQMGSRKAGVVRQAPENIEQSSKKEQ